MSLDLLALQAETLFVLSPRGRMLRANDPDASAAPRLYMAGGAEGWIAHLRDDVDDAVAAQIEAFVADEPLVTAPGAAPRHAERYRALLGTAEPLTDHNFGPVHLLPHGTVWPGIDIVAQGTPQGDTLWTRLARDGLPGAVVAAGFTDLTHFWTPWCVALAGAEIAAIAFAARLGARAAEIGVYTLDDFRGRGFAAAVTAGWSAMPALKDHTLLYSTHRDNVSSRRVIARLGLPFVGESFRLE